MKLRTLKFTKLNVFFALILFFPLILLFINLFYTHDLRYGEYFVKGISVSMLLFLPVLFLKKGIKPYLYLIVPLLSVSSVMDMVHMAIYKSEISQNGVYAVLETNTSEASEFIKNYLTPEMVIFFLCLTVVPIILLFISQVTEYAERKRNLTAGILIFFILISLGYSYKKHKMALAFTHHPLTGIIVALNAYEHERKLLQKAYTNIVFKNISVSAMPDSAKTPDVLVVVIGESFTAKHAGLYGYDRQTTPKLEAMKSDLIVFKHPYTKFYSTIPSLTHVFSYEEGNKNLPLIDILNKAGLKTAWVSNQAALGIWETMLTVIVKDAQYNKYLNNSAGGLQQTQLSIYDSNMEKPLADLLKRNGRQVIFLHLMGSHSTYSSRYPESYNKFTGIAGIAKKTWLNDQKKYDKINAYDNSILYNDSVVTDFIRELDKSGKSAALMYFSDHGENVYDDADFAGHSDAAVTTCTGTVPLIFWLSDSYKKANPAMQQYLIKRSETRYNIASLKDMILKMSGITFKLK